jgi:hypothetical protein
MSLFSMFGWPDCAKTGCGNPGLVKVELDGPAGPLWAHLCITCLAEMRQCLTSLEGVQKEAEQAEEQLERPPGDPPPAGLLEQSA